MTQEELLKNKKAGTVNESMEGIRQTIEDAPNDTTPYAVNTGDMQYVVGDTSKIDKVAKEYKLHFRLSEEQAVKYGVKNPSPLGNVIALSFKEGLITNIGEYRIKAALVQLLPYFKMDDENGLRTITTEELENLLLNMPVEMMLAVTTAAQGIFNIDDELASCIRIEDAVFAVFDFMSNNKDYINSADFISGLS